MIPPQAWCGFSNSWQKLKLTPAERKGAIRESTKLWDIFPMTRRIMLTHKTTDAQSGGGEKKDTLESIAPRFSKRTCESERGVNKLSPPSNTHLTKKKNTSKVQVFQWRATNARAHLPHPSPYWLKCTVFRPNCSRKTLFYVAAMVITNDGCIKLAYISRTKRICDHCATENCSKLGS